MPSALLRKRRSAFGAAEHWRYAQKVAKCYVTGCDLRMIQSFKRKGLGRFFKTGKKSGIQAKHANRLRLILGRLNASTSAADMDLPGLYLHQLTGDRKET